MEEIDEELLEDLYTWVDQVPLSRPKKDIKRDFSDGVQVAETVKHFLPSYVEMHNYPSALKFERKITNWNVLNRKVFKKLGFEISDDVIKNICNCRPWAIEKFLMLLRRKIDREIYENARKDKVKQPPHEYDPRTEADRAFNKGGRNSNQGHTSPGRGPNNMMKGQSVPNMQRVGPGPTHYNGAGGGNVSPAHHARGTAPGKVAAGPPNRDMVPKMAVEQKEQEILAKDETIQILQAKVRRLEHLLHLKDVRIDDLQAQIENMNVKLRPTANYKR